ncbi:MAG: PEP-CTERM sorting domain-containing protein [Myxococcota bacterium]
MIQRRSGRNRMFDGVVAAGAIALLIGSVAAGAATRNMTGSLGVQAPSVQAPNLFESGPAVLGKKQGIYPPTAGFATVQVAGATAGTFIGRKVTLPANRMNFVGGSFRDFPAFPNVGQVTRTNMDVQQAATFMNGAGALAFCPGPGCVNNGAGTAISWCAPLAHNPGNPAPGTVNNKVGNWNCTSYGNPGAGNRRGIIRISNDPGAPHYGGTLGLLRNFRQTVWRVPVQPSTPMANNAQAIRDFQVKNNFPWTGGRNNFEFTPNPGTPGPRLFARLNGNGAVEATFGCANGVGTVGQVYLGVPPAIGPFNPIVVPGNNCGTDPNGAIPGQGWGFRMTTGTISGSDDFPFSNETTALGTPFNPHRVFLTAAQGFFFTRMGDDSVVGTVRNLVLLGGALTVDPASGNVFNRVTSLRMRLQVPEPAGAVGLLIGAGALVGIARRRR